MGILFNQVMTHKRNLALRDLKQLNIHVSQTGKRIEELDHEELMYEWRLAAFKMIDAENGDNAWF